MDYKLKNFKIKLFLINKRVIIFFLKYTKKKQMS